MAQTPVGDYAAREKARQDRANTAVSGLSGDIKKLNDTIEQLQNTQGQITAEDQALLDSLETQGDAVAAKLEALDSQTPGDDVPPSEGLQRAGQPATQTRTDPTQGRR